MQGINVPQILPWITADGTTSPSSEYMMVFFSWSLKLLWSFVLLLGKWKPILHLGIYAICAQHFAQFTKLHLQKWVLDISIYLSSTTQVSYNKLTAYTNGGLVVLFKKLKSVSDISFKKNHRQWGPAWRGRIEFSQPIQLHGSALTPHFLKNE